MNWKTGVLISAVAGAVIVGATAFGQEAARPRSDHSKLPDIWAKAGSAEQLKAIRVAELDGTRLLMERAYGFRLVGNTYIHDLALESDEIRAEIAGTVKGVATIGKPVWKDDGTVEVERAIKIRSILEVVMRTMKQTSTKTALRVEVVEKVTQENQDTIVSVIGLGGITNSDDPTKGVARIRAKRAAELDAYRKLAERLMGVEIITDTFVRDFALASDQLKARVAERLKGAKPTDIVFREDGSCEVTMQIKLADEIEIVRKYSKKGITEAQWQEVERKYETRTLTETGRGLPKADQAAVQPVVGEGKPFQETEIIIRRVISQKIVIE